MIITCENDNIEMETLHTFNRPTLQLIPVKDLLPGNHSLPSLLRSIHEAPLWFLTLSQAEPISTISATIHKFSDLHMLQAYNRLMQYLRIITRDDN